LGLPNAHLGLPNADLGLPNAHSCPLNMKGESHSKFPKFLDFFLVKGWKFPFFLDFFFGEGVYSRKGGKQFPLTTLNHFLWVF
jgi:hypothetical protein